MRAVCAAALALLARAQTLPDEAWGYVEPRAGAHICSSP
jgi:hypothetical protein